VATAYCVKCKAQRDILDPQQITMKNGRPATQGRCPVCGTKIFKIGALETAPPPEPSAEPEAPEAADKP
jgi:DNA-directed RNA polymerase subunit RPC12/RpoP